MCSDSIDLVFILDESLSMVRHDKVYVKGLNMILEQQKRMLRHTASTVSIIKFGAVVQPLFVNKKIGDVKELINGVDYCPNIGHTALFDAIYLTLFNRPKTKSRIVCVILTDGEDNYSDITLGLAKEAVEEAMNDNVKFVYLCPTENCLDIGCCLGIETCILFSESENSINHAMSAVNLFISKTHDDTVVADVPENVTDEELAKMFGGLAI